MGGVLKVNQPERTGDGCGATSELGGWDQGKNELQSALRIFPQTSAVQVLYIAYEKLPWKEVVMFGIIHFSTGGWTLPIRWNIQPARAEGGQVS